MQQFISDLRKHLTVEERKEKSKVMHLNGVPFYVNQRMLDSIRKQGIYDKYVDSLRKLIQKGDRSWINS